MISLAKIGGKVENGETPMQATIRECHEELTTEAVYDENLINKKINGDSYGKFRKFTTLY